MTKTTTDLERELGESLSRIDRALAVAGTQRLPATGGGQRRPGGPAIASLGSAAAASALVVVAVATGQWWVLAPAAGLGAFASLPLLRRRTQRPLATRHSRPAHIGMGATVADDAILEPGATVEMGATIGEGATVRAGAIVRMGATVDAGAVIESGAVVSFGATIHHDAVVGERAVVGAGSDVNAGAHVPAGTRMWPGTTYSARGGGSAPPPQQRREAEAPRIQRIHAVCDRLDGELREAPATVRDFLGGAGTVIGALRRTFESLMAREAALRAEADPGRLAKLEEERTALEKRLASEQDEVIRRSLRGAVAAIEEQRRQRELFGRNADRLDAEQTRLLYTLEGMATQFVRLRTAGAELSGGPAAELEGSVNQLRAEIDAIADALEQVSDPGVTPVAEIATESSPGQRPRIGQRQ